MGTEEASCVHQNAQVHMGVRKICSIGISVKGVSIWEGNNPTVKVRTAGSHRRIIESAEPVTGVVRYPDENTGVSCVNGAPQNQGEPRETLTASIQEARSAGLTVPHSPLTVGVRRSRLTEVNKRA